MPSDTIVAIPQGTTLFAAVRAVGLPIATACQADGVCGRCGLRVLSGAEHLSQETDAERALKDANRVEDALRISCVATVHGPVVVTADYW